MKRKEQNDIRKIVFFTGAYMLPLSVLVAFAVYKIVYMLLGLPVSWKLLLLIIIIPVVIVLIRNAWCHFAKGIDDYDLFERHNLASISPEKKSAMHPKPNPKMLSKMPLGFVLGKYNNKYFGIPFDPKNIVHALVIGQPGSGKSTTLLTSLIQAQREKNINVFALDVKPELCYKSTYIDAPDIRYVDPSSYVGCGWDPFYGITPDTSDDDLIERVDSISRAIIVDQSNDNLIFSDSARNIFIGCVCYSFRKGRGFIDAINQILAIPMQDLLAQIMADKEMKNHPKIKSFVSSYTDDNETTQSIKITLRQYLAIFQTDTVKNKLQDCPLKACPTDLTSGFNIYIAIPDNLLKQYSPIFRLITRQVLDYLASTSDAERSKEGTKPIWLLLDEFGSIGAIGNITEALARFRSRKIYIWLAVQGLSQLDATYGHDIARSIWDNCQNKIIFSNSDRQTAEIVSALCGKYRERRQSITRGKNSFDISGTNSNEYRNIVEASDLMLLKANNEVLVLSDYGFNIVQKAPYYSIKEIDHVSRNCVEHNEKIMKGDSNT